MITARRIRAVVLPLLALLLAVPQLEAQTGSRPELVVVVSIDQLRGDLLEEFGPAFDGGLRRLLEEGRVFPGSSHLHAVTSTAAGHATLATGVFPSRSGIVGNSWDHRTSEGWQRGMYAVEDPDSPILGAPEAEGRSPRNLLRGGLADWIQATDRDARIVSISGKDRAAITLAGTAQGHVYWILPEQGRFVTSAHYRGSYPDWVETYNDEVMPELLADTIWSTVVPPELQSLARADEAIPFENDGVHTTFPHRASEELGEEAGDASARYQWLLRQPSSDEAVLGLALTALEELELGRRGTVDFLGLSFSSTDYVGHDYGPFSQEQLDNLVRLDERLGRLFTALDETVGEGRWVVGFSADHGVMTTPEAMRDRGQAGLRIPRAERLELAERAFRDALGLAEGRADVLSRELARILEERGIVEEAYTHAELTHPAVSDSFAVLFRNSHHPGRAHGWFSRHGVEIRDGYHELVTSYVGGTTHESPYWYDRWVPLILMGGGVEAGEAPDPAFTIDLAPTLAEIVGIEAPLDLDGRVLRVR